MVSLEMSANIVMQHQFIKNQLLVIQIYFFFEQEVKKELVQYFKNKERVLPTESKNLLLYNGDIETAYLEIINLYDTYGNNYFKRIRLNYND